REIYHHLVIVYEQVDQAGSFRNNRLHADVTLTFKQGNHDTLGFFTVVHAQFAKVNRCADHLLAVLGIVEHCLVWRQVGAITQQTKVFSNFAGAAALEYVINSSEAKSNDNQRYGNDREGKA